MKNFLWEPSSKKKEESLLEDFSKFVNLNQTIISKLCGNGQ